MKKELIGSAALRITKRLTGPEITGLFNRATALGLELGLIISRLQRLDNKSTYPAYNSSYGELECDMPSGLPRIYAEITAAASCYEATTSSGSQPRKLCGLQSIWSLYSKTSENVLHPYSQCCGNCIVYERNPSGGVMRRPKQGE